MVAAVPASGAAPEGVQTGPAATAVAAAAVAVTDRLHSEDAAAYCNTAGTAAAASSSGAAILRRADAMAAVHAMIRKCSQGTGQQLHSGQEIPPQQHCKWQPDSWLA